MKVLFMQDVTQRSIDCRWGPHFCSWYLNHQVAFHPDPIDEPEACLVPHRSRWRWWGYLINDPFVLTIIQEDA